MIPNGSDLFPILKPVGIVSLPSGRTLRNHAGEHSRFECHILDLNVIDTNFVAFIGKEHGHLAAVRRSERHKVMGRVGNCMIFVTVTITSTVYIHPALLRKPAEVHCHPESNVHCIVTGPRIPRPNQLFRCIAGAIIIRCHCRLELVHYHLSIVIAVDDTICHVDRAIFSHQTRFIRLDCQFWYIARRNSFTVPNFLAIRLVQQVGVRVSKRGIMQTNDIHRIAQLTVVHHLLCNISRSNLI